MMRVLRRRRTGVVEPSTFKDAAARGYPPIMIALGVISTLLWLFWLTQTMQVYRIAAYISLELRPRLIDIYQMRLLEWESYVRRFTANRESAAQVLYRGRRDMRAPRIFRNRDGVYISLLFGGGTPLLLTATAITRFHFDTSALALKIAAAASLILWICALSSAISVMRTTQVISRIIVAGHDDP